MAVRSSFGCEHVHAGDVDPGADPVLLGGDDALALRSADDHRRVERDERRRGVRRVDRDAAVGVEDRVLAVHRRRRVGVADVAAGAVAGPAAAVVPAARVLRHVAAERALVADLRRGDQLRRFHQQAELLAHHRVLDDLGERRHRADLEAAVDFLDALELLDLPEVDDRLRLLQAILEPVHAVEPARQHQRVGAVLVEQLDRIIDARPAGTARTPA